MSMESVDLYLSDECGKKKGPPKTHRFLGHHHKIFSKTPELDGAIGYVTRVVSDWRTNAAPHSVVYLRRIAVPEIRFGSQSLVFQISITKGSSSPTSEFRQRQTVFVNEEEIGNCNNKYADTIRDAERGRSSRFSQQEEYQYIGNPNQCPFSNCWTNLEPRVVGVSFRDAKPKLKHECLNCEGGWTTSFAVVGVE